MPLNAQGAGQPEQFDGVGEHADDVVATLVHRCVAPRRVRRGLPTSTAGRRCGLVEAC